MGHRPRLPCDSLRSYKDIMSWSSRRLPFPKKYKKKKRERDGKIENKEENIPGRENMEGKNGRGRKKAPRFLLIFIIAIDSAGSNHFLSVCTSC